MYETALLALARWEQKMKVVFQNKNVIDIKTKIDLILLCMDALL
jgi:hypothetical protein